MCLVFALCSCMGYDINKQYEEYTKQQIKENVEKIFGTTFSENQDWSITSSGVLTINSIPTEIEKIQLMTYVEETDSTTSLFMLNEANVNGQTSISLAYDIPDNSIGMYLFMLSNGSYNVKAVNGNTIDLSSKATTRGTL